MLSYAGVNLLYELDDELAVFLERFLSLEGGRIFADSIPPQRELRHGTQGHNSHLMGLPTFNWPPEPPPRLNTLRWPSGATRWATCFVLCSDIELAQIQAAIFSGGPATQPAQLVIADGHYGMDPLGETLSNTTITDNSWSTDSGRSALSTEMWMLTPKRVTGTEYSADALDRLWICPLVDCRYWWQFIATDSAFYSDVKIIKTSDTTWEVEFIGKHTRTAMPTFAWDASLVMGGTVYVGKITPGTGSVNEVQEVKLTGVTSGTYTLSFTPDGSTVAETTEPIPFDATAEEMMDAISGLDSFQVTWDSLLQNIQPVLDALDGTADPVIEFGEFSDGDWFPDRTEFRRRHENVAIVFDAIAASTGRRIVRDVIGNVYVQHADDAKTNLTDNGSTTGPESWNIIAGGIHTATTASAGNYFLSNGLGSDIPEAIDVVFRDLTREGRKGEVNTGVKWESQSGLLIVTVPMAEAVNSANGSQLTPFFPHTVKGLKHTVHTPSLNNKGVIVTDVAGDGDNYSKLAVRIAAKYYDWLWSVFDLRFEGVKHWEPTGFDDFWEIEFGRWRLTSGATADPRSWGTRVVSLPRNAMSGQQLVQCGTQCKWTEDMIQGEIRETLCAPTSPRLEPCKARAWVWLPPMVLQGDDPEKLWTHKRAATVTYRSVSAGVTAGTYFEAHVWYCANNVVWLDCRSVFDHDCGFTWEVPPSLPGAWAADEENDCPDGSICTEPTVDGVNDGDRITTPCLDDGSMTLP